MSIYVMAGINITTRSATKSTAFDAWYRSPEYQAAIPIRHASAETGFFVTVKAL